MTLDDFTTYGIIHFSSREIEATGASLASVQARLFQHLEYFRREIGRAVYLIKNGLTTGNHSSQMHVMGLAVDVSMKKINPHDVLKAALTAGFKGIGLYFKNGWVTVHLDLRADYTFWRGVKRTRERNWRYLPLIDQPE